MNYLLCDFSWNYNFAIRRDYVIMFRTMSSWIKIMNDNFLFSKMLLITTRVCSCHEHDWRSNKSNKNLRDSNLTLNEMFYSLWLTWDADGYEYPNCAYADISAGFDEQFFSFRYVVSMSLRLTKNWVTIAPARTTLSH